MTDNGSEFSNPRAIEYDASGQQRTRPFYCDPSSPFQKPEIERNHELVRMVLPKGKSFDDLTQGDVDLLAYHINSLIREKLNDRPRSDSEGNTLEPSNPAAFQNAMQAAFYGPLGELTVPVAQRNFATKANLPSYPEKIAGLKAEGAKLVTVFGIGRMFHIAFWEPHFAAEFKNGNEWKKQPYRLGAKLHPLTVEQNAITSFKSRTTLVPCRANTIGPGLFLQSDRIIGGCDGALGRGMQWQGMSLWVTLRYGPDMWIPSSFMPTMPGKLFYLKELAGPLVAECN